MPLLWPPAVKSQFIGEKNPNAWKDWKKKEKRMAEDETVRWHHWVKGHEFEETPGDSDGQGSLTCWFFLKTHYFRGHGGEKFNLKLRNFFSFTWFSSPLLNSSKLSLIKNSIYRVSLMLSSYFIHSSYSFSSLLNFSVSIYIHIRPFTCPYPFQHFK